MTKPVGMMYCREIEDYPDPSRPCPACGGELEYNHPELRRLECRNCEFQCWDDPDEDTPEGFDLNAEIAKIEKAGNLVRRVVKEITKGQERG